MILFCGPFSVANHARMLENCFNDYVKSKDKDFKNRILQRALSFTLIQCQPKISQRFETTLHRNTKCCFYEMFKRKAITAQALREGFLPLSRPDLGKRVFNEKAFFDKVCQIP